MRIIQNQSAERKTWFIKNGVRGLDFRDLPRCSGVATSTNKRCRRAAQKGKQLCGIHSGIFTPGAPMGNSNARTHGYYSRHSQQELGGIKELLGTYIQTLKQIEKQHNED